MAQIRVLLIDGDNVLRDMRKQILSHAVLQGHSLKLTALNKLPRQIDNEFDLIIIDAQLLQPDIEKKLRSMRQKTATPMMVLYKRFDTASLARKILGNPAGLLNTDNLNQITQKWLPKILSKATRH
jgi:DNA-binding response OmpR family regulator